MPKKDIHERPRRSKMLQGYVDSLGDATLARLQVEFEATLRPDSPAGRFFQLHGHHHPQVERDFNFFLMMRLIDEKTRTRA